MYHLFTDMGQIENFLAFFYIALILKPLYTSGHRHKNLVSKTAVNRKLEGLEITIITQTQIKILN